MNKGRLYVNFATLLDYRQVQRMHGNQNNIFCKLCAQTGRDGWVWDVGTGMCTNLEYVEAERDAKGRIWHREIRGKLPSNRSPEAGQQRLHCIQDLEMK